MSLEYNLNIENKTPKSDSDGVFREIGIKVPKRIKSRLKRFKMTHFCQSCRNELPFEAMAKNSSRPNGLDGRCKQCKSEDMRTSRRLKRNYANDKQTEIF